jgi:hypothetical protein
MWIDINAKLWSLYLKFHRKQRSTCIRKCNTTRLCFIIIDIHQQFYFNLMIKLYIFSLILGLWCLTPLSTMEYTEKTTELPQVTEKLYYIMLYWVYLAWAGFEFTTLVVICTDCTFSCKSNYHAITTTAP